MRTNIEINDQLIKQAMKALGASTKRETVDSALKLAVRIHGQTSIRRLYGKVEWDGDLKQLRAGRDVE